MLYSHRSNIEQKEEAMLQALSVMTMVASFTVLVLVMVSLIRRDDWRIHLAIGICFVLVVVGSIVRLLVFGQSNGWTDGFWLALYIFVIWTSYHRAKKLYALRKKGKK